MDAWRDGFVANSRQDVENAMSEVWIQPTGGALGADVHGVDLSKPVSEAVFRHIAGAWREHLGLRFCGPRLPGGASIWSCALRASASTTTCESSSARASARLIACRSPQPISIAPI